MSNYERQERLENSFRLKETKEEWQLNASSNPELDPGPDFSFFGYKRK